MVTVHLILPFPFEDDVQFLVGFVGVQEAAVLAGSQRLEGEFAPGDADGLGADFRFSVDDIVVPGQLTCCLSGAGFH